MTLGIEGPLARLSRDCDPGVGPLSRSAGEEEPGPRGSARGAARGQAARLVGEGP